MSPLTPEKLAELRGIAAAAFAHMIPPTECVKPDWYSFDWLMRDISDTREDAWFIEAFNPAVVLSLLDALEAKERELVNAWDDGCIEGEERGYCRATDTVYPHRLNPYRKAGR